MAIFDLSYFRLKEIHSQAQSLLKEHKLLIHTILRLRSNINPIGPDVPRLLDIAQVFQRELGSPTLQQRVLCR